jgi:hypothetical protein
VGGCLKEALESLGSDDRVAQYQPTVMAIALSVVIWKNKSVVRIEKASVNEEKSGENGRGSGNFKSKKK